jgi:hypothetical protein
MCLLCEELWMAFEPPPEARNRTFVADAPAPDSAAKSKESAPPSPPESSADGRRS